MATGWHVRLMHGGRRTNRVSVWPRKTVMWHVKGAWGKS